MIASDAGCTHEIKYRIVTVKATFNKMKTLHQLTELQFNEELVKCYIWSPALHGAEKCTLQKVDQKYPESFEIRCCRRMVKIGWTYHARNEEVQHIVKEERNILTTKTRRANWVSHILHRNCLLEHVICGKIERIIEVRRHTQLLSDLMEMRG